MLHLMFGLPPFIQGTPMASSDVVTFWVIVGIVIAVVLVATILLVVTGYRRVPRQSQTIEAERRYEATPQPLAAEQPQVNAPEKEEILLRR